MAFLQKVGSIVKRSAGSGSSLLQAVRSMSSSKVFVGGPELSLPYRSSVPRALMRKIFVPREAHLILYRSNLFNLSLQASRTARMSRAWAMRSPTMVKSWKACFFLVSPFHSDKKMCPCICGQ